MSPMTKRFVIVIGILVVVFGAIFGWDIVRGIFMKKYFASFTPPPVTISATAATERQWQPVLRTVGTLTSVHGVNISSEVPGLVKTVAFKSGKKVDKNQLLIQLDDATDRTDLANYAAQLKLDQADYDRKKSLLSEHAVAKADFEQATATLDQAKALVAKAQNLIEKKQIRAPFAGRVGISQINPGQYVSPGVALVTLQSIDPLYLQFSLPEQNLSSLSVGQKIELSADNQPDKKFTGMITAIDSKVDENTRSILLQATVPNADQQLFPGTFADIQVMLPQQLKVVSVPQTAITFTLYGDSVFVLKPDAAPHHPKEEQQVYIA